MTTLAVLQPGYLPWAGYFDQMMRADIFVHYDDVQFDKNGWRNRNRLKGPRGPVWLTVPVRHDGLEQRIDRTRIDNAQDWARKHVATLNQLLARTPHGDAYLPALSALLLQGWDRLVDLDLAIAGLIAGWFGIDTPTWRASALGIGGDRNDRLLALCRHFGADRYLSGAAARDYLDVARFAAAGITVEFQDFAHPVHPQRFGPFVSHLAAVDLIANAWPPGWRLADHPFATLGQP